MGNQRDFNKKGWGKEEGNVETTLATEMAQVGVRIVKETVLHSEFIRLMCNKCGQIWDPPREKDGKFAKRYWHCPNRCNTPGNPKRWGVE
jgi:hypothetical protein